MFVVLETAEARYGGIFGGFLNILTKPKPHIETRAAYDAAYGVITASNPIGSADWNNIAELAGRYGDTMLFPKGTDPPPPLREVRCPRFANRLLLGTAIEIIKRTRMPMYRRIVGLIDENGEYAGFLFELLHHYTTVKVLSKRHELYEAQALSMMEELGAPVILCEDYDSLSDCVLIIAPDGIKTSEKLGCPVLGKPASTPQSSDFITNLQFVPSVEQTKLCPAGIEPHRFFAALYEYCKVETIGNVASRMTFRNVETDLTQVVHAVMKSSGTWSLF